MAFLEPSGELEGSRAIVTCLAEGLDAVRRGREGLGGVGALRGEVRPLVWERRVRRGGMLSIEGV